MMKALHSLLLLFLFTIVQQAQAQLTVKPGTVLAVYPGTELTFNQDLVIENGAFMDQFGSLFLKGNFTNRGYSSFGRTAKLYANGTVAQSFNSNETLYLPHLAVNNAAGLTLNTPVMIIDSLVLVNGVLQSSAANPVRFDITAANPEESANSYILGQAIMEEREVGSAAFDPFLGFSMGAGADVGNLTLVRNTGPDAVITAVGPKTSIAANWNISTTLFPTQAARNTTFSWVSSVDNNINMTAVDLYGRSGSDPFKKLNQTSVNISGADPRSFSFANMDTLIRTFTASSSVPNVRFISFSGELVGAGALLKWVTGAELNNRGFEVERSTDGTTFTKIVFVAGKNGAAVNSYEFLDAEVRNLNSRAVYYRLKQIDEFGNYQYTDIVTISLNGSTLYTFKVYPNTFNDVLNIEIDKEDDDAMLVRLISTNGAVVLKQRYYFGRRGKIVLRGLSNLAAGVYILDVSTRKVHDTFKAVKSNN